jgi:hypothetical protein
MVYPLESNVELCFWAAAIPTELHYKKKLCSYYTIPYSTGLDPVI